MEENIMYGGGGGSTKNCLKVHFSMIVPELNTVEC
jgi:hypothetical protein